MTCLRSLFLLLALFWLLLTPPAPAQRKSKPHAPTCGSWDLVFSPNPNGGPIFTAAAAVPGTIELWGVGYYVFNYWLPLVEHWDGTEWQIVASPIYQGANHYLYAVTAVAPNDAWAVGLYEPQGGGNRTLILHWDGISWSIVPSPSPATYSGLYAVAAASATDVWAVGYYFTESTQRTLIEHWDGKSWSILPSPNVGTSRNLLAAVTIVPNSQAIWAVGYYYRVSDGNPSTLIQRWNGSTWQIVPSPSLSSSLTALVSVSSISATDVWAVGSYFNENAALLTLAQHWDGMSWQVFSTPNPAGFDVGARNAFTSVATVPGMGVWGLGYYEVPFTSSQTLTAFYCPVGGPTPTPTPTATATPTPTATPSVTPSPTATPIATPTPRPYPKPRP